MLQTIYSISDYKDQDRINSAIAHAFASLKVEKDLTPGMKVIIKPNLVAGKSPDQAPVVTHPAVIRAVALWLRSKNITNILLAESSGGLYNHEHMNSVYRACHMDTLSDVLSLNQDFTFQSVHTEASFKNQSFNMITPICQGDYIINIAKLKTHGMTGYSGGIKNLFGTIPGLQKPQLHYRWPDIESFSNMLLEIAQTVSPQITILDGIEAMEGNGPTGGDLHPMHLLFAARDLYTQDCFAASLMGLNPKDIVMLRQAMERGLAKPDDITLAGDPVPDHLTPFAVPDTKRLDFANGLPGFLQKPFVAFASKLLRSYPKLDPTLCVGCGKCAESCPPGIIKIKNNKAHFQRKNCISCFCCQEMCPRKAISVKKAL